MRWSKTFVFPKIVNSVDFVHRFDERNLGVRSWLDNEVRVTIEGEDEADCTAKKTAVDEIGLDAGGFAKEGKDGEWRATDR